MTLGGVGQQIEQKLQAEFSPSSLLVTDESDKHIGHTGARPEGETHFKVELTSPQFVGKSRIEMHRAINQALAEELAGPVHALAITAQAG